MESLKLCADVQLENYNKGYKTLFNGITDTITNLEEQIEKLKMYHIMAEEFYICEEDALHKG